MPQNLIHRKRSPRRLLANSTVACNMLPQGEGFCKSRFWAIDGYAAVISSKAPSGRGLREAVEEIAAQKIKMFYGKNIETALHALSLTLVPRELPPKGAFRYL